MTIIHLESIVCLLPEICFRIRIDYQFIIMYFPLTWLAMPIESTFDDLLVDEIFLLHFNYSLMKIFFRYIIKAGINMMQT